MIKLTALLPRQPSMIREEFIDYHRRVHAPLLANDHFSRSLVKRYEQAHNLGLSIPGLDISPCPFDGIAELWFDTKEDLVTFYTDDHYLEVIAADEEKFIDRARAILMISTTNVVF